MGATPWSAVKGHDVTAAADRPVEVLEQVADRAVHAGQHVLHLLAPGAEAVPDQIERREADAEVVEAGPLAELQIVDGGLGEPAQVGVGEGAPAPTLPAIGVGARAVSGERVREGGAPARQRALARARRRRTGRRRRRGCGARPGPARRPPGWPSTKRWTNGTGAAANALEVAHSLPAIQVTAVPPWPASMMAARALSDSVTTRGAGSSWARSASASVGTSRRQPLSPPWPLTGAP